jgi:hypothetical protein
LNLLLEVGVALLLVGTVLGACWLLGVAGLLTWMFARLVWRRWQTLASRLRAPRGSAASTLQHIADPWDGFQRIHRPTAEAGSTADIESGTSMLAARQNTPRSDPAARPALRIWRQNFNS